MADPSNSPDGPLKRPDDARRLARFGVPGAVLAFLLARFGAAAHLAAPAKSLKLAPVALVCCAEASWLAGGMVGLLVALQWLVHQLAHVHAARQLGRQAGRRAFIPFVGVFSGATAQEWGGRENEAWVALSGVLAGLAVATALFAYGQMLESAAVILAAKLGFAYNLAQMLPFRPFDGGRIFPGALVRYEGDADPAGLRADRASLRFLDRCQRFNALFWRSAAAQDAPAVLRGTLNILMLVSFVALAGARLLLPPVVFSLLLLAAFAVAVAFIAAVLALDVKAVLAPARVLHGRFSPPPAVEPANAPPAAWRAPATARAALAAYGVLTAALALGFAAA